MPDDQTSGHMPDAYELALGALDGLPGVLSTAPSTIRTLTPVLGYAETWIVQTYRKTERNDRTNVTSSEDTIFLEYVGRTGHVRLALPDKVAARIAQQRDSLTKRNRRRAAKERAQDAKDRGELPGFMRPKDDKDEAG